MQPLPGITHPWFSLFRFRSPLLTESLLFSLPVGTEMFHFPTFPPHALYIQARVTRHHSCWVSPFGHPRISARLTAPRGLSQPPTSFIGSWCQGIHRTLLHTYNKDARVHCAVLKQHTKQDPHKHQTPTHSHARTGMTCSLALSVLARDKHAFACSLRTQQYADIFTRRPTVMVTRDAGKTCQCSTHELLPFHMWERNRLCHTTTPDNSG